MLTVSQASIAGVITFIIALYISKIGVLTFLSRITKKKSQLHIYYACYLLVAGFGIISILVVTVGCSWPSGYYWAFFANSRACDSQVSEQQQKTTFPLPSTNPSVPGYPLANPHSPRRHHRARSPRIAHQACLAATDALDQKGDPPHSLLPPPARRRSLARPQRIYPPTPPPDLRRRSRLRDRHHLARSPANLRPRRFDSVSAESFHRGKSENSSYALSSHMSRSNTETGGTSIASRSKPDRHNKGLDDDETGTIFPPANISKDKNNRFLSFTRTSPLKLRSDLVGPRSGATATATSEDARWNHDSDADVVHPGFRVRESDLDGNGEHVRAPEGLVILRETELSIRRDLASDYLRYTKQ
jgi:hypothetical protein